MVLGCCYLSTQTLMVSAYWPCRCCHGSKTSTSRNPWESKKRYRCTTIFREWWKANIDCNQSKCRRSCRSLEVRITLVSSSFFRKLNLHNLRLIRVSLMSLGCVCNAVYRKHILALEEWYARFVVTGHYRTQTRRRKALWSKIKRRAREWEDNPLTLLGKVKPRCNLGNISIRMFRNFLLLLLHCPIQIQFL